MRKEDETIEKLLTIEKTINDLLAMRQQVIELRESETHRQEGIEALGRVRSNTEPSLRICRKNYSSRIGIQSIRSAPKTMPRT